MIRKMLSILLALIMLTACLPAVAEEYADMLAKGEEYLAAGDLARALASYQIAQKLQPEEEAAYLGEANVLIFQVDVAGAAAIVDEVLVRTPNSPEARGLKCQIDALQGDISAFEADVLLAEACGTDLKDAYLAAATMYLAANMPEKAADVLAKAMAGSTDETPQQAQQMPQPDDQATLEQANAAYEAKDYETALTLYTGLAEGGNMDAQYALGNMYADGLGVPQSYKEAAEWYLKAAEQENEKAQYNLGIMYENGMGVMQSYEEAAKWYLKAAERGVIYAQFNLGIMYSVGQGVPKSFEEAAKWFRAAAEQGDAKAQYTLGYLYQNGLGVAQSNADAAAWYQKAAEQGHTGAQEALQRLMTAALPAVDPATAVGASSKGFGGPVWVDVNFDENGRITALSVGNDEFAETQGIGSRVPEDADFISQFIGMQAPVSAEDIDVVTGATVTSLAVINAVNNAYENAFVITAPAAPAGASAWPMMMENTPSIDALNGKEDCYVLDSGFLRSEVGCILFSGSLDGVPADAWDVSADQNGSVMAWVAAGTDGLYDLHIAGNGGVRLPENSKGLFFDYSRVKEIDFGFCVSTANVANMGLMFEGCSGLRLLDVSHFDTANVTYMGSMFSGCTGLTALDVSHFDTANVTDMIAMFNKCSNLTVLDVSHFDTANVKRMALMFKGCSGLRALDVSHFDTANVTDMSSMFWGCSGVTALDVSNFNTANVTDMFGIFNECSSLTVLDVSNFNTANVTDMYCMFNKCSGLTELNLSHFNTANVTNMGFMFDGCSGLTALAVSNFDTANVTDMSMMFRSCSGLQSILVSRKFVVPESASSMFQNCPAGGLTYID